jgi:hypothetical protein
MIEKHEPIPTYSEDVQRLLLRAQSGDLTCLPELRSLLETKPELWQQVGDLADHAELALFTLIGRKDLLLRETLRLNLANLKQQLAGPSASPLEQLVIRRIAVSWIQVHHADMEVAEAMNKGDQVQCARAEHRLDAANRRYLFAIRQLATVCKLLPAENIPLTLPLKSGRGRPPRRLPDQNQLPADCVEVGAVLCESC